jgi:FSR family fosmidomycin resistance protein-like MFS transporter
MYSGMLPLLLLVLTNPLGLSYSQVGLVAMAFTLTSSLSQPFFGWLGDRKASRWLAVSGVAAIATTMGVMRFANSFTVLIILALIAGLGSAAFHPQGAVLATRTPPERRGSAMSIFMLGGNAGYAFGPVFASLFFALAGAWMPPFVAIIGLTQAGLVYWAIAQQQALAKRSAPAPRPSKRAATSVIITLAMVIFLRSWVQTSANTFIPQVYKAQGLPDSFSSAVLFSILMPLAIGGLIGGTLSDRVGRRRILIASTAFIGPALWGLVHFGPAWAYLWGALLGISIGASLPVTLVMAQDLIPRGLGMMSGIVLGFTFIAGAVGVTANGFAADSLGLVPVMTWNAIVPVGAALLSLFLPDDRPVVQAVVQPEA